jgi:hypothetical protein
MLLLAASHIHNFIIYSQHISRNNNVQTVGNIFSHDNAVVPGERVAQMATTIHRPDVGYSGT